MGGLATGDAGPSEWVTESDCWVSTTTGLRENIWYSSQQETRVLARSPTRQEVCMRKYALSVFFLAMLAIAVALACGSSPRALQSVILSPPTADAQGKPVQFTATGSFNDQPSPASLSAANWGACYQNQRTTAVSVSADGLAHCAVGAVGTYTVWAWAESAADSCGGNNGEVPANPCGGSGGCQVTGTAQLTCP